MKISTRGRYGLRAMIDVATGGELPVSIRIIAQNQDLSVKYLEHIMKKLVAADLVKSIRGPKGGYVLSRGADEITVGSILRLLEDDDVNNFCMGRGACSRDHSCAALYFWKKLKSAVDYVMDSTTLEEICRHGTDC